MENGLPGHLARVHPDVEPFHFGVFLQDVPPKLVDQLRAGFLLFGRESEEIPDVAVGNHQGMEGCDREGIPDRKGQGVGENHVVRHGSAEVTIC